MKKRVVFFVTVLAFLLTLSVVAAEVKGPFVDSVYYDVRMQEDIGLKDTAEGRTDVFMWGLAGPTVQGLDQATLGKLDLYNIPSGSLSILMNPIPNAAPYTVKVENKEYFNPLAIREIRFALNTLINRQYIVDEILGGAGGPMFTMTTPGQPGTVPYELNAAKMGFSATGDEAKAIAEINAALTKASQLAANKGKLKKGGKFWEFNGQPISVKFAIRVDDPTVRVREGEYIALQLEKAGIQVERLMWDRSKCNNAVYGGDPADYLWTMYTEGWGAGATRAFWAHIVAQMHAPWYGYMPGGAVPEFWNYTNDKIDELTIKAYTGDILTGEEYWDTILEAQALALKDAVRIQIAYQSDYFAVNKANMTQRMAYGLGDGINQWSIITAKPKGKTLRVTQFSAKGSLFMSSWDPIGVDGFSDTYSRAISDVLYDPSMPESPVDGIPMANRAEVVSWDTKVHRDKEGNLVGEFDVPANAQIYNPKTNKWEAIGAGVKAQSVGKYKMTFSNFHHGIPMSLEDFLYGDAFVEEWRTENEPGDPWYDAEYDSQMTAVSDVAICSVFDEKTNTFTVYGNYNFPINKEYAAANLAPGWSTSANAGIGVTWEISEALARMVALGKSASGEIWSFSGSKKGTTEVDVLNAKCVADIKAELNKMIAEKWIPEGLRGITTADKAIKRYQAALKWIDTYGHAYISNGPFYLAKYDANANYAEVRAFRDPSYPHTSQSWLNKLKRTVLSVQNVEVPVLNMRGRDIKVKVRVGQSIYPEVLTKPATVGEGTVTLITNKGEVVFKANRTAAGVFEATVPGTATKDLPAGSYTLVLQFTGDKSVVGANLTRTIVLR